MRSRAPKARRRLAAIVAGLALSGSSGAWASFDASRSVSLAVSTAKLAPPTGLTASAVCGRGISRTVVVRWTPSTTTAVRAYEIFRADDGWTFLAPSPGQLSPVAMVQGRTTREYTDDDLMPFRRYRYAVRSRRGGWWSAQSPTASAMTGFCSSSADGTPQGSGARPEGLLPTEAGALPLPPG